MADFEKAWHDDPRGESEILADIAAASTPGEIVAAIPGSMREKAAWAAVAGTDGQMAAVGWKLE